ncbi:MAG: DM13 domain-containing protein [Phycisphaerales bacterium]|nr:DM13 domain-containing protein [Phycisphaerales bacterium]
MTHAKLNWVCTACVAAVFVAAGARAVADSAYPRAGWVADLSTIFHAVNGTVTIVDATTLQVDHFTYDGGGPAVYFYLGAEDTDDAYFGGLEIQPHLTRAYNDESFTLTLPSGSTLDGYTAVSVWCAQFSVNFGSGVFEFADPSDADNDGDIDIDDYAMFEDCMAGPDAAPTPLVLTTQECLDAFDRDNDGDVDARDFSVFQQVFTGASPAFVQSASTDSATAVVVNHPNETHEPQSFLTEDVLFGHASNTVRSTNDVADEFFGTVQNVSGSTCHQRAYQRARCSPQSC